MSSTSQIVLNDTGAPHRAPQAAPRVVQAPPPPDDDEEETFKGVRELKKVYNKQVWAHEKELKPKKPLRK